MQGVKGQAVTDDLYALERHPGLRRYLTDLRRTGVGEKIDTWVVVQQQGKRAGRQGELISTLTSPLPWFSGLRTACV
jgi:uncharacterized protein YidB (DUF937 family)